MAGKCSRLQAEKLRVALKVLSTLAEDRTLWSKLGTASEATGVVHDGTRTWASKARG